MSVVSISMPDTLLERIDEFVVEHGYSGRSEVVRESTRRLLEEFQTSTVSDHPHLCTVSVTFEYDDTAVQHRLTRVRHDHDAIVSATTRAHAGDRYCMELFVLEGTEEAISGFVNSVRGVPDICAVDYSITSLSEDRLNPSIQS